MVKQQFYIPICVDNLALFFAFGFITPASVFPIGHYIPDELSLHPNVIPLHKKPSTKVKIPRKGIQASRDEDLNIKSAIVIVSLDDMHLEQTESSNWLYLDQILPTYCINEIIFEDQDALEHFWYLTRNTGRVSDELLSSIKFKQGGFDKLLQSADSNELAGVEDVLDSNAKVKQLGFDRNLLHKMSGYGAVLALTYVMTKNSKVANDAFKMLSEMVSSDNDPKRSEVVNDASLKASTISVKLIKLYLIPEFEGDNSKYQIIYDFFDVLLGCSNQEKVLDKLIPFFELYGSDPNASGFIEELKTHVHDILKGKVESTKSEHMEAFGNVTRVSQFIAQVVTMFTLLEETEKLFTQPINTVGGDGYVNIAVAYGMRDKFYEVPKKVRQISGLERFVIERMYKYFLTITNKTHEKSLQEFSPVPTIVDILDGSQAPELKSALSYKFNLVSKNLEQTVIVGDNRYVPKFPERLIEIISTAAPEFAEKMIAQKAFEDIDFNVILKLYDDEKALIKARKKFANQLNKI